MNGPIKYNNENINSNQFIPSEPSDEVSLGATINPETGAAINRRTSKIGIRCPALMTNHK